MRAGDGGEIIVKVMATSPTMVSVHVTAGVQVLGQLNTSRAAVVSGEGRRLILEMVDRGLGELLPGEAVRS